MQLSFDRIKIGARNSPLSHKQVEEVCAEIHQKVPHLFFETIYVDTLGDKDKKTSLRMVGKSDFFTRELDEMLSRGECA